MMNESTLLIVFLKVPKPGYVKTRLAATLGPDKACEIYCELVEGLLERIRSFQNVELRIAPDDGIVECVSWLQPHWTIRSQGAGDLGARMSRAFEEAFLSGWGRVLAIGSDCPYVGIEQIQDGRDRLNQDSVVLGPARDGGYWMIGTRRYLPSLFDGIEWSTEKVLAQTKERVEAGGESVSLLETLEDIDDLDAWNRFTKSKE
jgi:rSAM/selenodomain-associated transferase 1